MNPLDQYPRARKVIYLVFWVASGVLSAAQIAVAAIDGATNPQWLTSALAVLPFVGTYIGFQAAQNIRERRRVPVEDVPHVPVED